MFKITYALGLPFWLRIRKKEMITILSFHRIGGDSNYFFDPLPAEFFDRILAYCAKKYSVIPFSDIKKETPKPKMIISFDDGYQDFYTTALPVLRKYSMVCNHNIVNRCAELNEVIWTEKLNEIFNHLKSNHIVNDELVNCYTKGFNGNWYTYYIEFLQALLTMEAEKKNNILSDLMTKYDVTVQREMMNWNTLKEISAEGITEIGCHTFSHESLEAPDIQEKLDHEIGDSIKDLEEKLKTKIRVLAFPNGKYTERALEIAKQNNIEFILQHSNRFTTVSSHLSKPFVLDRINMIHENYYEAVHRIEGFHSILRALR